MSAFIVPEEAAGQRLDIWIATETAMSRTVVQRMIENGDITVNGEVVAKKLALSAGDQVAVTPPAKVEFEKLPAPDLQILYEDDDIMVLDKPAGLLVHPGNGRINESTLADFARGHVDDEDDYRPGIVHRLDRDTSGLIVIARNPAAKAYMQKQFADRNVHKTYLLLAKGRVEPAEAKIDLPIGRDARDGSKRTIHPGGRTAQTSYRTLAAYPGYTYIEAEPKTGRTHQLRVHFAAIGHPIVGDIVYGDKQSYPGLKRHFLHAAKLSFTAPNGKALKLESPLPQELNRVLKGLDKDV